MDLQNFIPVCEMFGLGNPLSVEENHEGVLNRNFVLTTVRGKYFLKSVRQKRQSVLPYIAQVEEFMFANGIPAVCMLPSVSGTKWKIEGDQVWTVYPFLENDSLTLCSADDAARMGEMLARIQKVGSEQVPQALTLHTFKEHNVEDVRGKLEAYKVRIETMPNREEVDNEFLDYIQLKLSLLDQVSATQSPETDTLTHGDYHDRNLLLNSAREIIGICDWEKAEMAPRAYELARAVHYICIGNSRITDATGSAKAFLGAYRAVYPLTDQEIRAGFLARQKRLVFSFWIEGQHYLHNDRRSDQFIATESRLIRTFSIDSLM